MKSCKPGNRASAGVQLALETESLTHDPLGEHVMLPKPAPAEVVLVERVLKILADPKLAPLLCILDDHNSRIQRRGTTKRAKVLLGPLVRQVVTWVQARNELRQKLPILDQPAAKVRKHFRDVSADCTRLARLVRRGPQPYVARLQVKQMPTKCSEFLHPGHDSLKRQMIRSARMSFSPS